MRQGVSGSLQGFSVRLAGQVGLMDSICQADHATRFTDVNLVVEATVVIAATSGIQEGATDAGHDGVDEG